MSAFIITWADPNAAKHYDAQTLCASDTARAQRQRSPKAQLDWEVSRALLHTLADTRADRVQSLSHSHGHAACITAPTGWKIGIDVERIQPRDVLRLAAWVCSPAEQHGLAQLPDARKLPYFYALWTLKEAFIKAAGLDFPADMVTVGFTVHATGETHLRAPSGAWQACVWRLGADWIASAVWQAAASDASPTCAAPEHSRQIPIWRTMAGCALPQPVLLYALR